MAARSFLDKAEVLRCQVRAACRLTKLGTNNDTRWSSPFVVKLVDSVIFHR